MQGPGIGQPASAVGAAYCTTLYWNVFVEIIKEPYISAAAPQGLLLPADLNTGRRVMKQASLEIHHCGEPKRFFPSLPPTLFSFFFLFFFSFFALSLCFAKAGSKTACMNSHLVKGLSQHNDSLSHQFLLCFPVTAGLICFNGLMSHSFLRFTEKPSWLIRQLSLFSAL